MPRGYYVAAFRDGRHLPLYGPFKTHWQAVRSQPVIEEAVRRARPDLDDAHILPWVHSVPRGDILPPGSLDLALIDPVMVIRFASRDRGVK